MLTEMLKRIILYDFKNNKSFIFSFFNSIYSIK